MSAHPIKFFIHVPYLCLMSKKGREHLSKDPLFREIIEQVKLPRIQRDANVYHALLRAIIFQQLSGKSASTIHQRFLDKFSGSYPKPKKLVSCTDEELRAVGLSRQKANYVRNVAQFWLDHQLQKMDWNRTTNEEVLNLLTQIKGVGTWTVQMLLMFTLNRPDVFPTGDLGIQNAIVKRYRLRSKGKKLTQRMEQIASAWSPYRTLACRYLWRWIDQIN